MCVCEGGRERGEKEEEEEERERGGRGKEGERGICNRNETILHEKCGSPM